MSQSWATIWDVDDRLTRIDQDIFNRIAQALPPANYYQTCEIWRDITTQVIENVTRFIMEELRQQWVDQKLDWEL